MTTTQSRLSIVPETDPRTSLTDRIRDKVAGRSSQMDEKFPRAVDLEAAVLSALQGELRGVASLLSGTHLPEHFRGALRGERTMQIGVLCRLATDPTREAKAASLAALGVLAHAIGHTLVPHGSNEGCVVDSAIAAADVATGALSEVTRAVADGEIDAEEAASLQAHATGMRRAAATFEAAAIKGPCGAHRGER